MRKNIQLRHLLSVLVCALVLMSCNGKSCEKQEAEKAPSAKDAMLSVIHGRTSVRKFIADKPVSKEDVETLMKAGMAAPSGKNIQPWHILVIDDRAILDKLAESLPHAKMLAHAPMAIVVCGDTVQSPYWYLDCSAASENILLTAHALGLGGTWTAAYPYRDRMEAVSKNVNMPANVLPLNVIPVGYPEGENIPKEKYDAAKVHTNKW